MDRIYQDQLTLNNGRNQLILPTIDIDPKTSHLALKLKRPTTSGSERWLAELRVSLCVEFDGEVHRLTGNPSGGILVDNRPGRGGIEIPNYSLEWCLPTGFFAKGNEPLRDWDKIVNKRWGETAKSSFRSWVEIDRLSGEIDTEIELLQLVEAAPSLPYHSSVAYQNAAAAYEAGGGDGALSLSFTAGDAGTDRVAFVFGSTSRDTRPTAAAVTYDGSISSDLGDVTNTYWRGAGGLAWHALIGSGAKTAAFTSSGGSGTQYGTHVGVISVTGAHQTTHGTVATNGADTGTALTCNVGGSPSADSLIVVGWNYALSGTIAGTTGADQTIRAETSGDGGGSRNYYESQPGTAGTAITHTKSNNDFEWVAMAIELKAAASASKLHMPFVNRKVFQPIKRASVR